MGAASTSETDFHSWVGAGDLRRAGEWLVHRFAAEVVDLCGAMVRDQSLAEDLAQEAFGKAFTGLAGFRGDASARTWLLRIARNCCIDHLRAQSRHPWAEGSSNEQGLPEGQPDDGPLPPELLLRQQDVQRALAGLNEPERALIVLRFRHGLSYRELAGAFGLRPGTVRMRVSRALAKMREVLEGVDFAEPLGVAPSPAAPTATPRQAPWGPTAAAAFNRHPPGAPTRGRLPRSVGAEPPAPQHVGSRGRLPLTAALAATVPPVHAALQHRLLTLAGRM